MTKLFFVFAIWASLQQMSREWMEAFNADNAKGLQKPDEIAGTQKFSPFDLRRYYYNHISYRLNDERLKKMKRFPEMLAV
jgi:predicted solute-binding protein